MISENSRFGIAKRCDERRVIIDGVIEQAVLHVCRGVPNCRTHHDDTRDILQERKIKTALR